MSDGYRDVIAALGDNAELQSLLHEMCQVTGMGFAALAYVSDSQWIACQVEDQIEFGLDSGGELEIKKTICDDVRRERRAILIDDTTEDPDWWSHPVPILYGFKSYVSLPILLDDGKFFGTLCAIDPAPRVRSLAERRDDLERLARQAARIIAAFIQADCDLPTAVRPPA